MLYKKLTPVQIVIERCEGYFTLLKHSVRAADRAASQEYMRNLFSTFLDAFNFVVINETDVVRNVSSVPLMFADASS